MQIRIKSRELEKTLFNLNNQGYTVLKSEIDGPDIILTAKKITMAVIEKCSLESIPEDKEKKEFKCRHPLLKAIWNGLKIKWIKH